MVQCLMTLQKSAKTATIAISLSTPSLTQNEAIQYLYIVGALFNPTQYLTNS
jgi:hypothetical protein